MEASKEMKDALYKALTGMEPDAKTNEMADEFVKMFNVRKDQEAKADYGKEEDKSMSEIRDDEPVVIFCNEELKTTLVEYEPKVSDAVVVTDVVEPGEVVVVPVKEFREWLYERKERDDPNKTV